MLAASSSSGRLWLASFVRAVPANTSLRPSLLLACAPTRFYSNKNLRLSQKPPSVLQIRVDNLELDHEKATWYRGSFLGLLLSSPSSSATSATSATSRTSSNSSPEASSSSSPAVSSSSTASTPPTGNNPNDMVRVRLRANVSHLKRAVTVDTLVKIALARFGPMSIHELFQLMPVGSLPTLRMFKDKVVNVMRLHDIIRVYPMNPATRERIISNTLNTKSCQFFYCINTERFISVPKDERIFQEVEITRQEYEASVKPFVHVINKRKRVVGVKKRDLMAAAKARKEAAAAAAAAATKEAAGEANEAAEASEEIPNTTERKAAKAASETKEPASA